MHKKTAEAVKQYRSSKRAASAKKSGGNWQPVAAAAVTALDDMRTLYKALLHMRALTYDLVESGAFVTPAPSEWDCVLDDVQRVADGLRRGLKGRVDASFLEKKK